MNLLNLIFIVALSVSAGKDPTLDVVLSRASAYVADYQRRLSQLVAEETYVQSFQSSGRPARRELKSDLLIVRSSGADRYIQYRDVFEVDGQPIRDREERLSTLFRQDSASATAQIRRIVFESARFNIGDVERTINVPLLALTVIDQRNRPRFKFRRTTERVPQTVHDVDAGSDPSIPMFKASTEVWTIEFRETETPTLIRTPEGRHVFSRGRLWLEPATGRVVMTELNAGDRAVLAVVDVSYGTDATVDLLVPTSMRERYDNRRTGGVTTGYAIYGAFRRFDAK